MFLLAWCQDVPDSIRYRKIYLSKVVLTPTNPCVVYLSSRGRG